MDKKTNKELILIAEEVLKETKEKSYSLFKDKGVKLEILDSYNGQISALGVSILMVGLKPALAIYYQDAPEKKDVGKKNAAYRRNVLEIVARMLSKYNTGLSEQKKTPLVEMSASDNSNKTVLDNAEGMVRYVLNLTDDAALKKAVIQCSVALKQVIRTYKLVESDGK